MTTRREKTRESVTLRTAALVGAVAMVAYGLLAIAFPYPQIAESPWFEVVWIVANLGVIAGIVAWTSASGARPRPLAIVGAALAIAGHALRIVLGAVLFIAPGAGTDELIPLSIPLMFLGMLLLGMATLIGRGVRDWRAWAPVGTVAAGLAAAGVYSADIVLHFVLLGILWGASWLLFAVALTGFARKGD